jgi:hypothetical protein
VTFRKGRERFDRLYAGGEDVQLLRRVARLLELDLEQLSGEKEFDSEEEYLRFTFVPCLMRVPERTTPSQIFPIAFAGIDRFLKVDAYPQLLNATPEALNKKIRQEILRDHEKHVTTFFGATIGYAFYYAYGEARAYSTVGEELPAVSVVGYDARASLTVGARPLTGAKGAVPRFVPPA